MHILKKTHPRPSRISTNVLRAGGSTIHRPYTRRNGRGRLILISPVQADVQRPSESGRREMGQAQEDPQPRIPSGEAQGTPNDFLLFDICLTITNWRFLLKPPMKLHMVLGRCSTKREILEFL